MRLNLFKSWMLRDYPILEEGAKEALLKFSFFSQIRNPVIFPIYVLGILMMLIVAKTYFVNDSLGFAYKVYLLMGIFIIVFAANFAESLAKGRGRHRAKLLRKSRREIQAKKLAHVSRTAKVILTPAMYLRADDIVLVEAGDIIPSDGEAIDGIASIDESAITGESAPVIREAGSDRCSVTGGTRVISDSLIVKVTANPGETFLDHMIELIEGSKYQKTPNELSLTIFLVSLSFMFLVMSACILPMVIASLEFAGKTVPMYLSMMIGLFVALVPTTVGALGTVISIAGLDRLIQVNVITASSRVVESTADVNVLLIDKTGTLTLGNRQAVGFIPAEGVGIQMLADAAQLASLADETPEGRSIVILAKEKYFLRGRDLGQLGATFIPFTAQTRMSGVNLAGRQIRKGAHEAVEAYVNQMGGSVPLTVKRDVEMVSRQGGTALVVAEGARVLGVIALRDIIKGGIRERLLYLRKMGIKTIMVTGDNPLTAAAIAAEAGVDDFLANATPENKLALIRRLQAQGLHIAMAGDGTNDAPALAQADVALAMNTGTQAAKEAGNLVDLDSNPSKLIEIITIGKQLLMTRGALTLFSLAADLSKTVIILPMILSTAYPILANYNFLHLYSVKSSMLSCIFLNGMIIFVMIPLALKGVALGQWEATRLFRANLLKFGLSGFLLPFVGIKVIDVLVHFLLGV